MNATPEAVETAPEVAVEPAAEAVAPEATKVVAEVVAEAPAAEAVEKVDEAAAAPATEIVAEPVSEVVADAAPETAAPEADSEAAAEAPAKAEKPAKAAPKKADKPAAKKPAAPRPRPAARPAAIVPAFDPAAAAAAEAFGRVDEEGNVWVKDDVAVEDGATERKIASHPEAKSPSEAMSVYVRRYLDLHAKLGLFADRLEAADLAPKEIDQNLARLKAETAEPAAIGDLPALRARLAEVTALATEKRKTIEADRAAAREKAIAERTALVEAAEKLAGQDPTKMQWRPTGEELRKLLDQWKDAQKNGPRIDRPTEDALWKRFSAARSLFDRGRRQYFTQLEETNASAKRAKEKLVEEAEKLQNSTDWGETARAYRDLMAKWKVAGRANRKDDDALWARFRAAQDTFFAAREADNAATDAEYAKNLEVKEAILVEAEALLPIKDIAAAKAAIRGIQDRWEAAGKVPRNDVRRVEGRLQAVEQAIRDFDQEKYNRTSPEKRARAEDALSQLESAIADLEAKLAKADKKKAKDLEAEIAAKKSWLEMVKRAAEEAQA